MIRMTPVEKVMIMSVMKISNDGGEYDNMTMKVYTDWCGG